MARFGRPRHLVLFGPVSIGDDVLCTSIFREWRRRGERGLWMMSRHAALLAGQTDFDRVVPIDDYHERALSRLGTHVVRPYYRSLKPDDHDAPPPEGHIIGQMCKLAGIRGEIALRPWLQIGATERTAGRLGPRQVTIHSTGRSAGFTSANKEWGPERFQQVVDAIGKEFDFVQVGSASDPPLTGARDLRGKTSLRETAQIVAASRLIVGLEGFLVHLARAVDVRAVVICGGSQDPAITGYVANENLYSAVPCAPCWQRNRCDFEHVCMTRITVADVVAAIRRADAAQGEPLPVQSVVLP